LLCALCCYVPYVAMCLMLLCALCCYVPYVAMCLMLLCALCCYVPYVVMCLMLLCALCCYVPYVAMCLMLLNTFKCRSLNNLQLYFLPSFVITHPFLQFFISTHFPTSISCSLSPTNLSEHSNVCFKLFYRFYSSGTEGRI